MEKIKLTRKGIDIKMRNGKTDRIMAWVTSDDTLACHKDLEIWSITHVPTGYMVVSFNGKYNRIRPLLAELGQVLDWSIPCQKTIERLIFGQDCKYVEIKEIVGKYETVDSG